MSGKDPAVPRIHVAVGVIHDESGRVLITRRSARQHLGGFWEFPGGKVEPDEDVQQTLARELLEELGITIVPEFTRPLCTVEHDYGDKTVLLDVWRISHFQGTPSGLEGQPLRWVPVDELRADQFPAANRVIIRNIQLPQHIALMDIASQAEISVRVPMAKDSALSAPLIRLRAAWPTLAAEPLTPTSRYEIGAAYLEAAERCLTELAREGHAALLDLAPLLSHPPGLVSQLVAEYPSFRGLHSNRWLLESDPTDALHEQITSWTKALRRHEHLLLGASCHNQKELLEAATLGADFALLSPVNPTPSHPDANPLGWPGFQNLVAQTRLPVYALGGMRSQDMAAAQQAGARGIAGVSLFQDDAGARSLRDDGPAARDSTTV